MFDKNNYAPRWARLGVQLSHISPVNYVGVGKISHFPALPSLPHPSIPPPLSQETRSHSELPKGDPLLVSFAVSQPSLIHGQVRGVLLPKWVCEIAFRSIALCFTGSTVDLFCSLSLIG